jgi:thiosulfate dehydrogenase
MKQFLLGVLVGLIVIPLFGLLYVRSGHFPVATAAPPFPLERKLAMTALDATISPNAHVPSPVPPTGENLAAGAKLYGELCAFCHGTSNSPASPSARGMYPPPPQLLHGKGVTDDPVGETYWKVANGIRWSGMPAYAKSLSETQMWQISQFLATGDHAPATR